jgi:hypothetical protein
MPVSPDNAHALKQELESIYCLYAALARFLDPETALGGKFVFAGELTEATTQLLRAANIAGAASLSASADAPVLRRAMRDGALDFVVTSLDEALRVLKNEIRKKQPVAVGVSVATDIIAQEMIDRGVQPDLLARDFRTTKEGETFILRGAFIVKPVVLARGLTFTILPLPSGGQQAAVAFEESLLGSLPAEDHTNRRWVHLAPRYLPAAARPFRSITR